MTTTEPMTDEEARREVATQNARQKQALDRIEAALDKPKPTSTEPGGAVLALAISRFRFAERLLKDACELRRQIHELDTVNHLGQILDGLPIDEQDRIGALWLDAVHAEELHEVALGIASILGEATGLIVPEEPPEPAALRLTIAEAIVNMGGAR